MRELQGLIETLARRLGRAVAIDDPKLRLLAHTAHHESVDDHRVHSIMKLRASLEVVDYAASFDIRNATAPLRVPRQSELGLLERVCVPIRFHDTHLGYLWLIDDDHTLTADDLAEAVQVANVAGEFLFRDQIVDGLRRAREKELFFDLVHEDPSARELLGDDDLRTAGFGPGVQVRVMVVAVDGLRATSDLEAVSLLLESAVARQLKTHTNMATVMGTRRSGECGIAIGTSLHLDKPERFIEIGAGLRDTSMSALDGLASEVRVGIGASVDSVRRARESYNQAQSAIRIAGSIPDVGEVALWDSLGVYRFLEKVQERKLGDEAVVPRLSELGEQGDELLLTTLEVYLDHAGNVQESARTLMIHRATLYYRLSKIEQLTGMSLGSGLDRLALHLGVKMARFQRADPSARSS